MLTVSTDYKQDFSFDTGVAEKVEVKRLSRSQLVAETELGPIEIDFAAIASIQYEICGRV